MGALTGLTRILQYSDTGAEPLIETLSEELDRMQDVHALLGVLADEDPPLAAPLMLVDVLREVELLHQLRIDLREVPLEVRFDRAALPLWAARVPLTQAMVLLVERAALRTQSADGRVVLCCEGDEEVLRVRTEPAVEGAEDALGALAAAAGATWDECTAELCVPTLVGRRRAERG
jgi:C4-dicarboxylate-specific signal transduction histidine kinase